MNHQLETYLKTSMLVFPNFMVMLRWPRGKRNLLKNLEAGFSIFMMLLKFSPVTLLELCVMSFYTVTSARSIKVPTWLYAARAGPTQYWQNVVVERVTSIAVAKVKADPAKNFAQVVRQNWGGVPSRRVACLCSVPPRIST